MSFALAADLPADQQPKSCDNCDVWNAAHPPFRIFGDTWYVGPAGLSVLVVRTSDGLVLLDGALPQSAEGVVANLRALDLDVRDVRYILTSHAHFDHVGGVAALQRMSGATVVTSAAALPALRLGNLLPDDPQAGLGAAAMAFPPVLGPIETVADGDAITLGGTRFVAHATPGHTPGGTSWSWQACEQERCVEIVYADSLNPVSADGFRYADDPARVAAFQATIGRVAHLECDVLVPVHPEFGAVFERADRASKRGSAAFVDSGACRRYAAEAKRRLTRRLREEG